MNAFIAKRIMLSWLTWLGLGFFLLLGTVALSQSARVKSEALTYPRLQITEPITVLPSADTYVVLGRPNESRERFRIITVGYETNLDIFTLRSLLQFDLTAIPAGSEITEATLRLHLSDSTGPNESMLVALQQVISPWPENITWRQHEGLTIEPNLVSLTGVGTERKWYSWSITHIVSSWLQNKRPPTYLGLIIKGDESPSQHQRAFWSKDCADAICVDKKPQLIIRYNLATPTPTPTATPTVTPTATPTLTPTPIPTPGIGYLRLRNEPVTVIKPGDKVTYVIDYGARAIEGGEYLLTDVVITNVVPMALELIPGSLPTAGPKLRVEHTGVKGGSLITWILGEPVADGAQGTVSYQALRPTVTPILVPTAPPTPGSVQLHKSGAPVTTAGAPVIYTLFVTNTSGTMATGVVITDRIPANAGYLSGGQRKGDIVEFVIGDLPSRQAVNRNLVLAASQTITNSDYGVRFTHGNNDVILLGTVSVVIQIGVTPTPTPDPDLIINQGAGIQWRYAGQPGHLPSPPLFNPVFYRYLPLVINDPAPPADQ